jgi:hypothetical protein
MFLANKNVPIHKCSIEMPHISSQAAQFLTMPFRRHKQRYVINPPDEVHNVVYLGNVLTIIAKGEQVS